MELERGTTLGHYEIDELIGEGGMGRVYRARDTQLGRVVAIKVLPDELAGDPERLERFEREARLLASLNHPNIATLHGMEQSGDARFLVMELVDGETLAEQISRGSIPLDDAVGLFVQVAEGLEAAHERGVVHRDLKPANLKITPEGRVKILDFGLAKALAAQGEVAAPTSQSPTLTKGTALGAVLGTVSYMSPEQARGKAVDKRTDVWAFGCCLYEALTGRKAFDGETVSDVIGAVLRDEPDSSLLPVDVSPLIERCLTKDPRERMRDIGDVRLELQVPRVLPRQASRASSATLVPWLLLVLAAGVALWLGLRDRPEPPLVTRFVTHLPEGVRIDGDAPAQHVAMAPDGSRIAYYGVDRGTDRHLYVLERDELTATRLPDTEGGVNPFFSPDGRWVGFFADGALKKISISGGAPITVCETSRSPGASWGADDTIVFASSHVEGLMSVPASGGEPETLTTLAQGERSHRWPQHLPDGERVLFSIRTDSGTRVEVVSPETGERTTLFPENAEVTQALYLHSGHLLYDQPGVLLASAFDVDALELVGTPASVLNEAHTHQGAGGLTHVTVTEAGDAVYVPSSATRGVMATLRERTEDGAWAKLTAAPRPYEFLAVDPEGRRIALNITGDDGDGELWLYDMSRSSLAPLARDGRTYNRPVWTPDGGQLTLAFSRQGVAPSLYVMPADGSGSPTALRGTEMSPGGGGAARFPGSWTPDGTALVYSNSQLIGVLRADGESETLMRTPNTPVGQQTLSPDGRWLAYVSNDSGRPEVWVTSFPTPGARVPISTEGGDIPRWSADGSKLYFRSGPRILDADVIGTGERFVAGVPRLVAEVNVLDYDVTPDSRLIAIWPEGSRGWDRLHVVLNWRQELERVVPTAVNSP